MSTKRQRDDIKHTDKAKILPRHSSRSWSQKNKEIQHATKHTIREMIWVKRNVHSIRVPQQHTNSRFPITIKPKKIRMRSICVCEWINSSRSICWPKSVRLILQKSQMSVTLSKAIKWRSCWDIQSDLSRMIQREGKAGSKRWIVNWEVGAYLHIVLFKNKRNSGRGRSVKQIDIIAATKEIQFKIATNCRNDDSNRITRADTIEPTQQLFWGERERQKNKQRHTRKTDYQSQALFKPGTSQRRESGSVNFTCTISLPHSIWHKRVEASWPYWPGLRWDEKERKTKIKTKARRHAKRKRRKNETWTTAKLK